MREWRWKGQGTRGGRLGFTLWPNHLRVLCSFPPPPVEFCVVLFHIEKRRSEWYSSVWEADQSLFHLWVCGLEVVYTPLKLHLCISWKWGQYPQLTWLSIVMILGKDKIINRAMSIELCALPATKENTVIADPIFFLPSPFFVNRGELFFWLEERLSQSQ